MPEETELITELQSDQPEAALGYLFDRYADRIYQLALGIIGDPASAEDVVQETFLSVITHRMQFEGRSSLATWLYRIATNASLSKLRKPQTLPLPDEEGGGDDDMKAPMPKELTEWRWTPDQLLMDSELRGELDKAAQSLPESLRVVFLLRDVQELSTEETAQTLGISVGAVKVRLHRARLDLRERLANYLVERKGGKEDDLRRTGSLPV